MTSVTSENITEQKPDNAPVEVADIMRLIKAAKSAGYVQSKDGHIKPNGPFKTLTLKDIAKKNSQTQNQMPPAAPSSAKDQIEPGLDDAAQKTAAETEDSQPTDKARPEQDAEAADMAQEPSVESADDASLDAAQNAGHITDDLAEAGSDNAEMAEREAEASPEENADHLPADVNNDLPEGNQDQDGFKTTLTPNDPPKGEPVEKPQNAEYQRGFEEGQAAAKQELETSLGEAIISFQAAAAALGKDDNIDLSQLDQAMTKAIIQLASARAGMAIDENPDGFAARIETMVSRIRNRVDEPVIRLHPQDAEIIRSQLEERLAPRGFKLTADETLKRGDARVDVGSIGVMDLIDDQVSLKPASTTPKKDEPEDV